MKYIVVIADGMADLPLESLGGLTPMAYRKKPLMDSLAQNSIAGMIKTVPDGMPPGSDVANLSLFGYDPRSCFTGRAPLEALSMGIPMGPRDVAFRCNLVNLSRDKESLVMNDYSAGHIKTEEAAPFIKYISDHLHRDGVSFHQGVSYRHLMLWKEGKWEMNLTPPHDIPGLPVEPYYPKGDGSDFIADIMKESMSLLGDCHLNAERKAAGKKEVSSVWLWGQGRKPAMPTIEDKFGLKGNVIAAVDLINGIGILAGLTPVRVEGATGYLDTNFEGKASAAVDALTRADICFVHIEACDETSHEGSLDKKLRSIDAIDSRFLAPLLDGLDCFDEYRLLLAIDHPTSVDKKIHLAAPVPFLIYDKKRRAGGVPVFSEDACRSTGRVIENGHEIMNLFIKGE